MIFHDKGSPIGTNSSAALITIFLLRLTFTFGRTIGSVCIIVFLMTPLGIVGSLVFSTTIEKVI